MAERFDMLMLALMGFIGGWIMLMIYIMLEKENGREDKQEEAGTGV